MPNGKRGAARGTAPKEALIYSDFVAILRYSAKIVPYISTYAASQFFLLALSCLELEITQSCLNYTNRSLSITPQRWPRSAFVIAQSPAV